MPSRRRCGASEHDRLQPPTVQPPRYRGHHRGGDGLYQAQPDPSHPGGRLGRILFVLVDCHLDLDLHLVHEEQILFREKKTLQVY